MADKADDDSTIDWAPGDSERPILKKGEPPIPLPGQHIQVQYAQGSLDIYPEQDPATVSVYFNYTANGSQNALGGTYNLNDGALTVGRGEGKTRPNTIRLPDIPEVNEISRDLATISRVGDTTYFEHEGGTPIKNPLVGPTPEIVGSIPIEGGTGGGYTHENRSAANPRATNEDMALATSAPLVLGDLEAMELMGELHEKVIIPRAKETTVGGSTLSIAMRTSDGHYACSQVGDSMFYVIAQHNETGDIKLVQVSVPHNALGLEVWKTMAKVPEAQRPIGRDLESYLTAIEPHFPELAQMCRGDPRDVPPKLLKLYKNLGHTDSNQTPEVFIVEPQEECPPGYTAKGIMVACDGFANGIWSGAVQEALKPLYANHATPDPTAVAEAAVNAARRHTSDNVTAAVLPGEGLVAVADGNYQSTVVARMAIDSIRELVAEANRIVSDETKSPTPDEASQGTSPLRNADTAVPRTPTPTVPHIEETAPNSAEAERKVQ